MRVIIYVRVSTREQAEKGYSIGEQEERLRAYCKAKSWDVVSVLSDPGFSGAKMERPGLQKVIKMSKEHSCDAVLVWKLDRLSRSQKDTLFLIEDVFLKNEIHFVSMNENFDTSTAFGRAMIGILSVFAQLEREQIKERSAIGREGRAKAGLFHGGGFAPIGYDYSRKEDGGAGLVVNEYEAMQVREVFSLYLQGWSVHKIRVYLAERYTTKYGTWQSDTSVRSVLTTPLYVGMISYGGKTYKGKHEPLISQEVFDKAQARFVSMKWQPQPLQAKVGQKHPFQSVHILGGLLWCSRCGARYFATGNYSGRGENRHYWPYYACYSRAKSNMKMVLDPNCKNDRWPVAKLDAIILDQIRQLALDPAAFEKAAHPTREMETEKKRELLQARLSDLNAQMERLLDLCQLGSLSATVASGRMATIQAEMDGVSSELDCLSEPAPDEVMEAARATLESAGGVLENGSQEDKRELVHSLINRIDLDGQNIDIHWSFAPAG